MIEMERETPSCPRISEDFGDITLRIWAPDKNAPAGLEDPKNLIQDFLRGVEMFDDMEEKDCIKKILGKNHVLYETALNLESFFFAHSSSIGVRFDSKNLTAQFREIL